MKRYQLIYPPTGEQVELLEGFEEERDRLLGRGWVEWEESPLARPPHIFTPEQVAIIEQIAETPEPDGLIPLSDQVKAQTKRDKK